MAEKNFDNPHPDYTATAESRTKSRDLYDGNRAVKAKTTTYLYKEERESDDAYTLRVKRAVLDNWIPKIVQARQGVIFRRQPERTLPKAIEPFRKDVDRDGTSDSVFFAQAAFDAQVDGIHWVVVDMPVKPEAGLVSRAQEMALRHRPFFQQVPGNSVIDWEIGPDGFMVWAVVQQSRYSERVEPGFAATSVPQWKIWYRDRWELYEANEDGETVRVSEGENTCGMVPLVPFFGVKRTEQSGWPVAEQSLDHIILLYNKASDLDRSERIAANPSPYVISPKKLELLNLANGFWICSEDAVGIPIEVGMLETSGVAFEAIRISMQGLVRTIYATALGQALRDSAQVQSADAQREDRKGFNASIYSASLLFEQSERRCWQMWERWLNPNATPVSDVKYNRDFDDAAITDAMIEKLHNLAGGRPVLRRQTFLETLKRGEIVDPALDIAAELAALDAEEAAATAALAKSLAPAAESMPPEPDTE